MSSRQDSLAELDVLLRRMAAGDTAARDAVVAHVLGRITKMASRQLRSFPGVGRWEQTDDVVQNVAYRLFRAFNEVAPKTTRELFGYCGELIRRELIDLKRHHYGPEGAARYHQTPPPEDITSEELRLETPVARRARAGEQLMEALEVHELVERLPAEPREVVNLLFYQQLSRDEAAAIVGVSTKTIARRWRDALVQLHALLRDDAAA